MALDLAKKQEIVRLTLEKRKVPTGIIMAVKFMLDVSGSTRHLFNSGEMQELVDRLIPIGMRFDDNQSLEAYAFSDGVQPMDDIRPEHFGSYVNNMFIPQVHRDVLWEGTKYGVAWKKLADDITPSKLGFVKNIFRSDKKQPPSFVLFVTDGDDQGSEKQAIDQIERLGASNCYVMLVGVGNMRFDFLQRLAKDYAHVGFVSFPDVSSTTDEQMYNSLLSEELCEWIKKTH